MLQTHVNLSDPLDSVRTGSSVKLFLSHADLVSYTQNEDRYFPKEDAYAGGLLKYLLREIDNKYHGSWAQRKSPEEAYHSLTYLEVVNSADISIEENGHVKWYFDW